MSRLDLLPRLGEFYKANLHAHTTVSDGHLTPRELTQRYCAAGYAIVCITDHRVYNWHKDLCRDDFLCLAGYEADINAPAEGQNTPFRTRSCYHFNFFDTDAVNRAPGYEPPVLHNEMYEDIGAINTWLKAMRAQGFLPCYNHPYWSLQDVRRYIPLEGLFAMEIYNHGCEMEGLYGYAPQAYDEMLRSGQRLYCLATDDNHNAVAPDHPLSDSFGGFTMIKAASLDYHEVMQALIQGHFYASTGPQIKEAYVEDGVLVIACSPVEKIYVITDGRDTHRALAAGGQQIESARFELSGKEQWIRIDCRDSAGRHAYSRAYWRDELGL